MTTDRVAGTGARQFCLRLGLLVAVAVAPALPVAAQGSEGVPPPAATADEGVIAGSWRALGEGWSGLKDGAAAVWDTAASAFLPALPGEYLPERQPEQTKAFLTLMDLAGYRLAKIETGGMVLSRVRYEFVQERRLTPEDAERVRRAIARHEAEQSGLAASYHRWVVRSLLDAALSADFRVADVRVKMRPFPSLDFRTVAVDRPLDDTERRLVQELRPAAGGRPR
ncbi:hypothetical protein EDC65_1865 [Stella humosa]|uniref:Uncharacterized protein n=1 Tax=Stella humosa TaxID=94 RepID=A0A3N1MBD7_9PROT|nr:hypothetical protein [Stella humosa]ROQ00070.1 hypothetical protein EDC65_1865 [Stella humosa]BBK30697.1 hypothetical protein STHU_13310 [Stella humosa]